MHVRGVDLVALGLVGLAACSGGAAAGERGYVLLDAAARDAGYALEIAGERVAAVLPVALAAGADAALVGPTGRVALSTADGELLWVEGADAEFVTHDLADELDDGVLYVDAPADAARALADALDGALAEGEDGWFAIHGEHLVAAAAALEIDADVRSVRPVLRARPVWAAGPRPVTPPAPAVARRAAQTAPLTRSANAPAFDLAALSARLDAFARLAADATLDARGVAPAVSCADAVAGTWVTQIYDQAYAEWYIFTLHVAHQRDGRLAGRIGAHYWVGDGDAARAPTGCEDDDTPHFEVGMTAAGTLVGDALRFGGTSHRVERRHCGTDPGYNLDQFSGKLVGSHFFAVNNDGGKAIDQPTPFRRVSCR